MQFERREKSPADAHFRGCVAPIPAAMSVEAAAAAVLAAGGGIEMLSRPSRGVERSGGWRSVGWLGGWSGGWSGGWRPWRRLAGRGGRVGRGEARTPPIPTRPR
jgi:hypothetical protein